MRAKKALILVLLLMLAVGLLLPSAVLAGRKEAKVGRASSAVAVKHVEWPDGTYVSLVVTAQEELVEVDYQYLATNGFTYHFVGAAVVPRSSFRSAGKLGTASVTAAVPMAQLRDDGTTDPWITFEVDLSWTGVGTVDAATASREATVAGVIDLPDGSYFDFNADDVVGTLYWAP